MVIISMQTNTLKHFVSFILVLTFFALNTVNAQVNNDKFIVERPEKYGGDLEYKNYEEIERDFVKKKLHPLDLKNAIAKEISNLLGKIDRRKLEKLSKKAYEEGY